MPITFRPATENDLPLLAQMNKRLIEDQGSRNPMSLEQLQARLQNWLHSDWHIDFFEDTNTLVGYVVYHVHPDEFFPEQTEVYVRQFFIERGQRGQGRGTQIFKLLRSTRFPSHQRITLEVLASNPKGYHFWQQCGFEPYYTTMHLEN